MAVAVQIQSGWNPTWNVKTNPYQIALEITASAGAATSNTILAPVKVGDVVTINPTSTSALSVPDTTISIPSNGTIKLEYSNYTFDGTETWLLIIYAKSSATVDEAFT